MSNYVKKIQAIIAKAESSTHPEEAEAFMAMAHKIMFEQGLDMLALGKLGDDPIGYDDDAMTSSTSYAWLRHLNSALATYYGCSFVTYTEGRKYYYSIAGRESARATFLLMAPYVEKQVKKIAMKAWRDGYYPNSMKALTKVGNATVERVWGLCDQTAKYQGEGVNALVPVDLLQAELDKHNGPTRAPRSSRLGNTDYMGEELAKQVNINVQASATDAIKIEDLS